LKARFSFAGSAAVTVTSPGTGERTLSLRVEMNRIYDCRNCIYDWS
jgi:hypothetical protein